MKLQLRWLTSGHQASCYLCEDFLLARQQASFGEAVDQKQYRIVSRMRTTG
jgi:hypothetical protein